MTRLVRDEEVVKNEYDFRSTYIAPVSFNLGNISLLPRESFLLKR